MRARGTVAALLAAGALLAGCAGPAPEESPSPAATTPAPDSSSPAPASDSGMTPLRDRVERPVPPAATDDDAGAVAFAVYYVAAQEWATATADPAILDGICLSENEQCARIRQTAEVLAQNSWTQYDGASTLAIASDLVVSRPEADRAVVQSRMLIEPLEVRDDTGAVVETRDSYDFVVAFHMQWTGTAWVMTSAVRVEG